MNKKIPKIQDADIKGKIVLVRVDHNVVKKGVIKDPYRIDMTLATIVTIISKGGKPILMSHVGRPKDKKTGAIDTSDKTSVAPITDYLEQKIGLKFVIPAVPATKDVGIEKIDENTYSLVEKLRAGEIDGIYLPNTRWFTGEEDKGEKGSVFAKELAKLADVFVNDAFGSWQPHASTYGVTGYLPVYAGLLMQKELINLQRLFQPNRPLLSVVAGSKFDTKVGTLSALLAKTDYLLLGGVVYNAYLAAKYGVKIAGIGEDDVAAAQKFIEESKELTQKILEPAYIVESETLEGKFAGKFRTIKVAELKAGQELQYILDAAPESFTDSDIAQKIAEAQTVFVNAVMGLTPYFNEGTTALYQEIDKNKTAFKMFGGGDTLQEFRTLLPGAYLNAIDDKNYYFFTGGGTVLTAIEQGSAEGLKPIQALLEQNK